MPSYKKFRLYVSSNILPSIHDVLWHANTKIQLYITTNGVVLYPKYCSAQEREEKGSLKVGLWCLVRYPLKLGGGLIIYNVGSAQISQAAGMGKLTTFGCFLKYRVKLVWVWTEVAHGNRQHLRQLGQPWLLLHRGSEEGKGGHQNPVPFST